MRVNGTEKMGAEGRGQTHRGAHVWEAGVGRAAGEPGRCRIVGTGGVREEGTASG